MAKKKKTGIEIWHKSNCSTSLGVLKMLRDAKVTPAIFEYIVTPPSEDDIATLLRKLGIKAEELVRKKEPIYKEKFAHRKMSEKQWIKALAKYPVLIERPIIIDGDKAFIGRPVEKVVEFLNN